jgi:hypothetical protein
MASKYPFNYLLLACRMNDALQEELRGWAVGDILEGFLEMESTAEALDDLWCYGWQRSMARLAPVQVTKFTDARPWLRETLGEPALGIEHDGEYSGSVWYFAPPADPAAPAAPAPRARANADRARLHSVLTATAELARLRGEGLLFVGCWGFDFKAEVPREQQLLMVTAGFQFVDRHP